MAMTVASHVGRRGMKPWLALAMCLVVGAGCIALGVAARNDGPSCGGIDMHAGDRCEYRSKATGEVHHETNVQQERDATKSDGLAWIVIGGVFVVLAPFAYRSSTKLNSRLAAEREWRTSGPLSGPSSPLESAYAEQIANAAAQRRPPAPPRHDP
ncbi:MAG: hypothetical protein ACTHN0_13860 [Aquihabitans sp.]